MKAFMRYIISCCFLLCSSIVTMAQTHSTPNIVLIFMDDMGYGDIGSYGATGYQTPNIDKLASEGMRFTNFYAAQPICTVSRAGLLTGCYPNRIGLRGAIGPGSKTGLNKDEETIPELLKKKQYHSVIIGKWHLGDAEQFLPLQHGFDEYFGLPYSNDMWPLSNTGTPLDSADKKKLLPALPLIEGNQTVRTINNMDDMAQLTTLYTERSVSFIKQNKAKPFFLYLAHTMPHIPLAVSAKFKGKSKAGLFGDVMMEIDWSVGEVMKSLQENGLEKNTLVIFTSDNGPWLTFGNHAGSSGGLREGKMTTWEGGQRVSCIMRWPGNIPSGTVNNSLTCTIDLLPTFAAITKTSLPTKQIDGVNIIELLKGNPTANPRDELLYYYGGNELQAVRKGNWKLVFPHQYVSVTVPGRDGNPGKSPRDSTGLALYNLGNDPGEKYNVKDFNPAVVKQLESVAEKAREDLGDDLTGKKGKNRREPGRTP
jgi:arylsulfatase A-like enzyme